ncbi:winged helix-turn-helix transcriptional regulator [Streptomyces sp. NPDC127108]|uniref:winged helix-turn-helix transcriptional regulator n=1 Tax=Streptomyces sp. NPDC127108 TaxID=3345361 RepID=UPI003628E20B
MSFRQIEGGADAAEVARTDALAREVFIGLANKWAILIVSALGERTLRFTELRSTVDGISHKMLTQTLRGLERDGVVHRTVHPTVPPRVEYRLTEAGTALLRAIDAMCDWTHRYMTEIETARSRFDAGQGEAVGQREGAGPREAVG